MPDSPREEKVYLVGIDQRGGNGVWAYIERRSGFALIHVDAAGMLRFERVWSVDAFGPRDRFDALLAHLSPRAGLYPSAIPVERLEGPHILRLVSDRRNVPTVRL